MRNNPLRGSNGRPTFALANICGGMTLSGPKACRGSTKEARTYIIAQYVFQYPRQSEQWTAYLAGFLALAGRRCGKRVVDSEGHLLWRSYAFERLGAGCVGGLYSGRLEFLGCSAMWSAWISPSAKVCSRVPICFCRILTIIKYSISYIVHSQSATLAQACNVHTGLRNPC